MSSPPTTEPLLMHFVAYGIVFFASYFEDKLLILLGRVIMTIGILHIAVSALLFTQLQSLTAVMLITTSIHGLSLYTGCYGGDFGKRDVYPSRIFYIGGEPFHDRVGACGELWRACSAI